MRVHVAARIAAVSLLVHPNFFEKRKNFCLTGLLGLI